MRGKTAIVVLLLVGAALLLGVAHLFGLRYEPGDLFAEYSSFRADPLGAKVLYESVGRVQGMTVRRNTVPLEKLKGTSDTVLLYLGSHVTEPEEASLDVVEGLEALAAQGGRVVVAFYPETKTRDFEREKKAPKSLREVFSEPKEKDEEKEPKKPSESAPSEGAPSEGAPSEGGPLEGEDEEQGEAPKPAPSDGVAEDGAAAPNQQESEAQPEAQEPAGESEEPAGDARAKKAEPDNGEEAERQDDEAKDKPGEDDADDSARRKREERYARHFVDLTKRWGLSVGFKRLEFDEDGVAEVELVRLKTQDPLPDYVPWRTTLHFVVKSDAWRTVYAWDDEPVLIERSWGRGTLVLSADSYFLSNEAMRDDRHPALLAWLLGNHSDVVFDEWHLGVSQSPGVMTLVRKYGLQPVLLSLLLLAALYLWRNGTYLVPPREETERVEAAVGKDAHSGFVNLLRRSIGPQDVMGLCVEEWKRDALRQGLGRPARDACANVMTAVVNEQSARPPKERDWPGAYRRICRILAERKARREP